MNKIHYVIPILILMIAVTTACTTGGSGNGSDQAELIDSLQARIGQLEDRQQLEDRNKQMVMDFYQKLFGDKEIDALDEYIGDTYIQHNPMVPDGKEPLRGLLVEFFKDAPRDSVDFQRVAADRDLVFLHIRVEFGGNASSVVDIFRLDNGKIVEHWDVIQQVPEESVNPHPMF